MKKGIIGIAVLVFLLAVQVPSYADTWARDENGVISGIESNPLGCKWREDEAGWWYTCRSDEKVSLYEGKVWYEEVYYEYYVNTWAVIEENGIGHLYCFDENGYLRTNQTTPDGYLVDENGALVVDGQVLEVQSKRSGRLPSNDEWASGKPYLGRWISPGSQVSQTQDSNHSKQIAGFAGHPFELDIEQNSDGKRYVKIYELKNGARVCTNTYEFRSYKDEKYVINTGNGKEMFYPSPSRPYMIESYPTLTYDGTIKFAYYIIAE